MMIYIRKRNNSFIFCRTWKYPRTNYCDLKKKSVKREAQYKYLWSQNLPLLVPWKGKAILSSQSDRKSIDYWMDCSLNLSCNGPSCWKYSVLDLLSTTHFLHLITSFTHKGNNASKAHFKKCWVDVEPSHGANILPSVSPIHLESLFLWKRC